MYIHQLSPTQYQRTCRYLQTHAHILPLDPSYTFSLRLPEGEYLLKLQPEDGCRLVLLHALQVERTPEGPTFVLITETDQLQSLMASLLTS